MSDDAFMGMTVMFKYVNWSGQAVEVQGKMNS